MSISAMKKALDVIETYSPEYMHGLPKKHYTKALHQAIAEAEAEKREWVGLTGEEVGGLTVFDGLTHVEVPILADFVRAIEAKLKEKNT